MMTMVAPERYETYPSSEELQLTSAERAFMLMKGKQVIESRKVRRPDNSQGKRLIATEPPNLQ